MLAEPRWRYITLLDILFCHELVDLGLPLLHLQTIDMAETNNTPVVRGKYKQQLACLEPLIKQLYQQDLEEAEIHEELKVKGFEGS